MNTLERHGIPLQNFRGQGYDNANIMSGCYKGVSTRIENENMLAKFTPCAAHSLYLCGSHAAECCPYVVTFFGVVQKLYIVFHGSTERWALLKDIIGESLHPFSSTRWSARIQCSPLRYLSAWIEESFARPLRVQPHRRSWG